MPSKDKYTDPKLRDEVKKDIQESDKGGAPGQWSARKAQMMASEYKKRGGDYNTDKSEKDESQKNLSKWGEEDWQTKEGSGNAKKEDGTQKRYLPKKAWENMSEEEKKETDAKKQKESKQGKQHVENTDKAKNSRKKASEDDKQEKQVKRQDSKQDDEKEEEDDDKENDTKQQPKKQQSKKQSKDDDEDEEMEDDEEEEQQENSKAGQKRTRSQDNSPSKKQKSNSGQAKSKKSEDDGDKSEEKDESESKGSKKTIGSKHMDAKEPGKKGSADRLPKKDQKVQWKAMPGYVAGKVVEVLKADKKVDGKSVKASEKDPKLVLKSDSSGKICVHKPDACFYD